MTSLMQPLRDEHAQMLPAIDDLVALADTLGRSPASTVTRQASAAHTFLAGELIPHATAEDRVLYPLADDLLGTDAATATMRLEHVEIARRVGELGDLVLRMRESSAVEMDPAVAASLRRVLYGLHALLRMHLLEEEEWLIPVLELGLTPDEAGQLFAKMHVAAAAAARDHAAQESPSLSGARRSTPAGGS